MEAMRMFCLPFAGGNKYAYQSYAQLAPSFMKVTPLELPGRGRRADEPLLTNIQAMADDVFQQIRYQLNLPYVLYGHSMGGLLAYLLTKKIISTSCYPPSHLFVTGCAAPSVREKSAMHKLPKHDFLQELKHLGGCPDEILNSPDSMNFFEPVIRADFQAVEQYEYLDTTPFDVPITAMFGMSERVLDVEMTSWQKETTEDVDIIRMHGNHFFIYPFAFQIVKVIARKINQELQKL